MTSPSTASQEILQQMQIYFNKFPSFPEISFPEISAIELAFVDFRERGKIGRVKAAIGRTRLGWDQLKPLVHKPAFHKTY